MPDTSFAHLAWLAEQPPDAEGRSAQEEYLRDLLPAEQKSIHLVWGFGALQCKCKAIPIPCPEHMARGVLVGNAILNGATGDVGELSDRELFKLAWPSMRKRTRCDCPTLWQPCKHALAHASGEVQSPLTDDARLVLLQLVNQEEQVDHPETVKGTDAATHETKSVPMAARLAQGFGPQSGADFLNRVVVEAEDRIERDPNNGPNGQPDPGPVRLRIFEPEGDGDTRARCWACRVILEEGSECPDCTRAREAMAKTMGRKRRKAAV